MDATLLANAVEGLPGDLASRVLKELKNGYQLERVKAAVHQKRIAVETGSDTRKSIDGIGRLRMRIDPTMYHEWGKRLGYGCWRDSQFLNEIERDNPEVRVKCGGTKTQIGYVGTPKFRKTYGDFSPVKV